MKILNLTDEQINKMRIDTDIQYVLKTGLKSNPGIKGIFKWGIQAWAVTVNDMKVPVKPSCKSMFSIRFDDITKS
jgi:hypothetical protein